MKEVSDNIPEQMEYAIGRCKIALDRMRKLVISEGFPDQKSEIYFFKKLKPAVYGKLLYYRAVFDLESKRQRADLSIIRRYFQKRLYKINEYFNEHQEKVQYYKCGFKYLDEKYFVRGNSGVPLELQEDHQLMDEDFFTWHDHTFSMIMAYEMLMEYIQKELDGLENGNSLESIKSTLRWTGKKIELAEIIYALHLSGTINDGNITIKELAEVFGIVLNINIGKDIYRLYTEIKQRKIEHAKFLDFLKTILKRRIDEDDE